MNGVFLSLNSLSDSRVWGSSPCYEEKQSDQSPVTARGNFLTMISTTKIAILHNELPRDRKFVKDSCPGVSMTRRPGILYSCDPS